MRRGPHRVRPQGRPSGLVERRSNAEPMPGGGCSRLARSGRP
jgi:hypothetical protein